MTANRNLPYILIGMRHRLRAAKMCPFDRVALEAQLDAMVMLYYTRWVPNVPTAVKNKLRGSIGLAFDPFTGNSDGS